MYSIPESIHNDRLFYFRFFSRIFSKTSLKRIKRYDIRHSPSVSSGSTGPRRLTIVSSGTTAAVFLSLAFLSRKYSKRFRKLDDYRCDRVSTIVPGPVHLFMFYLLFSPFKPEALRRFASPRTRTNGRSLHGGPEEFSVETNGAQKILVYCIAEVRESVAAQDSQTETDYYGNVEHNYRTRNRPTNRRNLHSPTDISSL